MAVQAQQHMLVGTEKGDWDIWGGSSDDYDDEY